MINASEYKTTVSTKLGYSNPTILILDFHIIRKELLMNVK